MIKQNFAFEGKFKHADTKNRGLNNIKKTAAVNIANYNTSYYR